MTGARVTTAEAAAKLNVPAQLISQWKHRGRIAPISYTTVGNVPVYNLAELEPHARAYHARRGHPT